MLSRPFLVTSVLPQADGPPLTTPFACLSLSMLALCVCVRVAAPPWRASHAAALQEPVSGTPGPQLWLVHEPLALGSALCEEGVCFWLPVYSFVIFSLGDVY